MAHFLTCMTCHTGDGTLKKTPTGAMVHVSCAVAKQHQDARTIKALTTEAK